jgi:ketosteroid isomerase-like protein
MAERAIPEWFASRAALGHCPMQSLQSASELLYRYREETLMWKAIAILASILLIPAAMSAPADDVSNAIHQFIDAFNSGDAKAVDAAYDKHAQATGVTDGNVKYSDSTRTEVDGNFAYAVVPVLYTYKEHGAPTQEEGQMTFALHRAAGGWKIQAWTWTGAKPHAY